MWKLTHNDQTSPPSTKLPHGEHVEWATAWPDRHEDHLVVVEVSPKAYASATSARIGGTSMRNR
jgi:hypothetical protein